MMKPLKVSCFLNSPLGVEPFSLNANMLDSLLEYELAMRMNMAFRVQRSDTLTDYNRPIPLSKHQITKDLFIWTCSDPIIDSKAYTFVEHYSKRLKIEDACLLAENERKSVMIASGKFKSMRKPIVLKQIDKIVWFCHGDRREIRKLLKKITSIGKNRNMGYGQVKEWVVEEIEHDYSISVKHNNKRILMKTYPLEYVDKVADIGYKAYYGGYKPPYWHPDRYREIATPC